jgi:hypothetical protein
MTPDEIECLDQSSDAREAVKVAVEAEDILDAMFPHHGKVDGISSR